MATARACAAYHAANRDAIRARKAAHYQANKAKIDAANEAWEKANPDKAKAYKSASRARNAAKRAAYNADWVARNKEKHRASIAAWAKANAGLKQAHCALRRCAKKQRTPAWADVDRIKEIYIRAAALRLTVDHIIPLQGRLASGLHVHQNLQLLPLVENSRKGNRMEI